MAKVLHLEASPRKARSHSLHVAGVFLDAYRAAQGGDEIETLDLWGTTLPPFDGATLDAKYAVLGGEAFTPEQQTAWDRVVAAAEHFKAADKVVLSSPMWNFGVPYPLKHYIDVITQPGLTFGFDARTGYFGLVKDRPACLVLASGGDYTPGSGAEGMDFQRTYLESWLRFVGFESIEVITVAGTLSGPEAAEAARSAGAERARQIAATF